MVFMRFRIFSVFMIWMVSGTTLDTILFFFRGLRVHCYDFGTYWRLLGISMNSRVSSETPRIQAPQSGEGKMLIPRAHYYRQLGGYSIKNTTYSMKQCHTGSKDVNVTCKCCMIQKLHNLVTPGKQEPSDFLEDSSYTIRNGPLFSGRHT